MQTVVITKHGGPGVLEVQERPDPSIAPGRVRIDVAASGINFADVMARMGLYPEPPSRRAWSATRSPARWPRWGRA